MEKQGEMASAKQQMIALKQMAETFLPRSHYQVLAIDHWLCQCLKKTS